MMLAAIALIAVLVAVVAGVWLSRRRAPAAAPQAALAPQAPVNASPRLDFAPVSAANNVATERLWRLAFAAPATPPADDPAERAIRTAIFTVLRADSLDPKYFPRRPTLMTQLMHAFNDERTASDQISHMITHDPVLTADVLRLANSTLYRTSPEPIGTIQRAVVVCGMDELRRLVATAMLLPVFRATRTNFPRFPRMLWERTERAARAAEMYAASTHPQDRFEAQMVTLLSALGPLVVYGAALDIYARSPRTPPDPQTFVALLRDLSSPMAQRIAKQWEAAPRLVAALGKSGGESLTTALYVGELMGTLSVLQSQAVITGEELHDTAAGVGLPDARIFEIAQRLAVKS
ncbi:MAG: HDOD domain-containing protein [Steroidobacterales bacterium]